MSMQDKELLFEIVPGGHLKRDLWKLEELGRSAGLQVGVTVSGGKSYLRVKYSDEVSDFKRTRNAGRPRSKTPSITCGEVDSLREEGGARLAAATLGMPITTFYRRFNENLQKKAEEPFV